MTNNGNCPKDAEDLSQKDDLEALSPDEILKIVHNMKKRQINLEIHNEELRKEKAEIEADRERYLKFYDQIPVSYFTLSKKGLILEANLAAADLLKTSPDVMVGQPISRLILKEDLDIYHLHSEKLFETGEPQECDLRMVKKDGERFWVHLKGIVDHAQDGAPVCRVVIVDITENMQDAASLKQIEWMLSRGSDPGDGDQTGSHDQGYGDLTELNQDGMILKYIGHENLEGFAKDYLELLGTSSAIYEANGDYAFGIFTSGWCRMMDCASRRLCDTGDNTEALNSGQWLCHESCWTDCSKRAIDECAPVDIECNGGLRIYAIPILAGGKVVGAINFGYGDPPDDPEQLRKLAKTYNLDYDDLVRQANEYDSRPPFIIELAKKRLHSTARLIGTIIESKQAEEALRESKEKLRTTLDSIGDAVISTDLNGLVASMNPVAESLTGWSQEEAKGQPLDDVFHIVNEQSGEPVESPVTTVLKSGQIIGLANHSLLISRDGRKIPIADSGAPIFSEEGNITGVVLVFRDQTRERADREALAENKRQFHKMLGVVPDMISIHSPQMDIMYSNWQGFGSVPETMRKTGTKCYNTYRGYTDICPDCLARTVLEVKKPIRKETQLPDGTWYDIRVIPFLDSDGNVEMFMEWVRDISEQKQAESALNQRLGYEQLLNEASTMALAADDLAEFHDRCLSLIGERVGIDRAYFFRYDEKTDTMDNTHEWCAEGITPQKDNLQGIPGSSFSWWNKTLRRNEIICYPNIEDIPDQGTKETLRSQDIKSILVVPVFINGKYFGFIGLDDCARRRDWRQEDVDVLLSFSRIVTMATERKMAEKALRESENRFKKLSTFTFEGIIIHNNAIAVDVNQSMVDLVGYEREELIGMNLFNLIHPDSHEIVKEKIKKQVATPYQIVVIKKDGSTFDAEIEAKNISYNGEFFRVACVRDITERKIIENELKERTSFLSTIMETSPVGIVTVDKTGNITYANNRAEQILGLEKEEITSLSYDAPTWKHTDLDGSPFPDEKQPFNIVKESMKTVFDIQHGITWPDGHVVILSINAAPILDVHGKFDGMIASIEDISELKQAELALKREKAWSENIVNNAPNIIVGLGERSIIKVFNQYAERLTGYKAEEVMGKEWIDIFIPEELQETIYQVWDDIVGNKMIDHHFENEIITRSGERRLIEWHNTILTENDEFRMILSLGSDITERKQAEEALFKSESVTRALLDGIPESAFLADIDGTVISANTTVARRLDQERNELIGSNIFDSVPEEVAEFRRHFFNRAIDTGKQVHFQDIRFDRIIDNRINPIYDRDGNITRLAIIGIDITERKRVEKELESNYELLRIAGETAKFGGWSVDLRKNICIWSDAVADIHEVPRGYSPPVEEAIGFYAPEWREKITEVFGACAREGIPYDEEMEILTRKGKRLWVRAIGEAVKNENGTIIGVHGSFQDITDIKQTEEKLKAERKRLDFVMEATRTHYNILDSEMNLHHVDPGWQKIYGDPGGRKCYEYFMGREEPCLDCGVPRALETKEITVYEEYLPREDRIVEVHTVPFRNSEGHWLVAEFNIDITERKQREDALRQSEEKYRTLIETTTEGYWLLDNNGRTLEVNDALCSMLGYDREHMMGTSPMDFMDHDNTEIFREEFGKRSRKRNRTYEIQMRSNDGKVHDVIINATNLKDIEGRPAGAFAMITDISGLKQINSELGREKIRSGTFLDLLSHDIGNIHQGILLSASIFDQNRMDESIKMRSLANIRNLANRSIHLVKNVILLTRLDSIDMDPREIDVVDMIERSVGSCRSVFPDRTIRHDTICQHESVMLEVEPIVGEVFFNLYHNSIKVQEREDPRIRTEVIVDRERSCVRVLISDWGPGIPDELKERLLYRTRKPGDKVHSGIGFSLVRELMKRYNGTIRIMDGNGVDQGPGACFELIFPLIDSK